MINRNKPILFRQKIHMVEYFQYQNKHRYTAFTKTYALVWLHKIHNVVGLIWVWPLQFSTFADFGGAVWSRRSFYISRLESTWCKPGGCQRPLGGKDINTEPAGVHIRAALPVAEDSLRHFVTSTNTLSNQLLVISSGSAIYAPARLMWPPTIPSDKNPHLPDVFP